MGFFLKNSSLSSTDSLHSMERTGANVPAHLGILVGL